MQKGGCPGRLWIGTASRGLLDLAAERRIEPSQCSDKEGGVRRWRCPEGPTQESNGGSPSRCDRGRSSPQPVGTAPTTLFTWTPTPGSDPWLVASPKAKTPPSEPMSQ